MNLFRPCFKPESFDLVISNGVLHHTSDPYLAFKSISNLVKPNGYIIIGLYHKYGRLYTNVRQKLIQNFGEGFKFLDKRTTDTKISKEKRYAWLRDQYKNPHETSHTLNEVKGWFEKHNIDFQPFLKKNWHTLLPIGQFWAETSETIRAKKCATPIHTDIAVLF